MAEKELGAKLGGSVMRPICGNPLTGKIDSGKCCCEFILLVAVTIGAGKTGFQIGISCQVIVILKMCNTIEIVVSVIEAISPAACDNLDIKLILIGPEPG